jgi:hypothetical protein
VLPPLLAPGRLSSRGPHGFADPPPALPPRAAPAEGHPSQGWRAQPHHLSPEELWQRVRQESKGDAVGGGRDAGQGRGSCVCGGAAP